jgi:MFS family permease
MNTSTVPTWQSETSKPHRRGQMVMIEGSLIVFGVMISYWIDLGFSFLEPSSIAWRFPIAFQIVLAIFILIAIPGLPESPRWLILKGRDDEALDVLAALSNLPREDKKIQAEFLAVTAPYWLMSTRCSSRSRESTLLHTTPRPFSRTALVSRLSSVACCQPATVRNTGWHPGSQSSQLRSSVVVH